MSELTLESKRFWGYAEDLIELWREDLRFSETSIRERPVFVYEEEGRIVGVVAVRISDKVGEASEMEDLWIHPASMGRGIGSRLFKRGIAACREAGVKTIEIFSDPNAESFYLHMGAVREGEVPSRPAGRTLPRLLYDCDPFVSD